MNPVTNDEVPQPESAPNGNYGIPNFRGKRKHQEWVQITAYLRRESHRDAKIALIEEEFDLSDLLEYLVDNWLEGRDEITHAH